MLPLPKLKQKTYQQIFEESKNKIPTLTNKWTDFNVHDPGITILQLFAWLFEMQHYYADFIGENHIYKYLELLGYQLQKEVPAKGHVCFKGISEDFKLPRGFKLFAGDVIFETEKMEVLRNNRIVEVRRDKELVDITNLTLTLDGGYEYIFSREPLTHFYIGFKKTVDLTEEFKIYFKVYEGNHKRKDLDKIKRALGKLKWEVYTLEGWQEVEPIKDETSGFLRDGYIIFKSIGTRLAPFILEEAEERYYFRCTLIENEYSVMPKIDYIGINHVNVIQKDTKAISLYLDNNMSKEYLLDYYFPDDGDLIVLLRDKQGNWSVCNDQDYSVEQEGIFKKLCFKKIIPKENERIRIIYYVKDFKKKSYIGDFGGDINESFSLEEKDVFYKALSLDQVCEKQGKMQYVLYKPITDMGKAKAHDKVFYIDYKKQIVFGDKTHGEVPRGKGNKIYITGFATTKGALGNVKAGKINRLCKDLGKVYVTNHLDMMGGQYQETKEEALNHFRQEFKKETRALTATDYEQVVRDTPGLLIHKVKAIGEEYLNGKKSNTICIFVKPHSDEVRPNLSNYYKEAILEHVEKYRLLTTCVKVESPVYLGIDVHGHIYKETGFETEIIAKQIYDYVKNFVDSLSTEREFGEPLIIGNLFGKIDSLLGVNCIGDLSIVPIGKGGERGLSGDIIVKPNVLTYLRNYSIELR